jgi:hypothetical protein
MPQSMSVTPDDLSVHVTPSGEVRMDPETPIVTATKVSFP